MESSPLWYRDRLLLFHSHRVDTPKPDLDAMYLFLKDPATGQNWPLRRSPLAGLRLCRRSRIHVFAAEHSGADWFHDIDHFWSDDLTHWTREPAIQRAKDEHLLNSSVCRDDAGFLMAYESDMPVAFCFKFARSRDLATGRRFPGWLPGAEARNTCLPGDPLYQAVLLRDLSSCGDSRSQRLGFIPGPVERPGLMGASPKNPILEAGPGEGSNNSDVDLIEIDGKTHVYYSTGDQRPGPSEAGHLPRHDGRVLRELLSRRFAADPGRCPVSSAEARHAHHDFKTARSRRVASIARFR